MIDHSIVKVFTSQVCVSGCCLYFKNAFFNGKNGDVESAAAKIENQNISFTTDLLVQTCIAIAAAVGSLMIRRTFKPEMAPASLVAWR